MTDNRWFRRAAALLIASGLSVTLIAVAVQAAPEGENGRPAKQAKQARRARFMALAEKLNLTEAQKAKLRDLVARHRDEVRKIRQGDGDKQAKRARLKELRGMLREEVMALLTPEQRDQLKAERQKARVARKAAKARA